MDVQLLGNVELRGDGGVVRLARSGERCVLATLAFSPGRAVTAGTLADNIWSAATQSDKAIETVADYVRKVRGAIKKAGGQPEWLRTDRGARAYVLDIDPQWVDYTRFTHLASAGRASQDVAVLHDALGLWRGPALADVTGLWAESRRYAVETERLAVYDEVLTHQLDDGQGADVVRTVTALIEEIVPTERLLLLGARGMAVAGQHAAIRGWVDRAAQRMREATDTAPSAELCSEIEQLINGSTGQVAPTPRRPTAPPAMFSLRGDIAGFTGRQEELRRLLDAANSTVGDTSVRGIALHTVDGMAGVGKTAFGVHAAHQMADWFPDGRLFVELHGHTPGQRPVPPAEALASLLLATGLAPAMIPQQLDDRARLWRHRIAGKKVLLVLDDAADHDQVRPLLPGTVGSLVLITSRHRLAALDGVRPVTLDVLPAGEAVRMLERLAHLAPARQDADAAGEVVAWCGFLPLAIALAAGRLRSHPSWTLRYLADQLAQTHDRLAHLAVGDRSVAAAFDMSFQYLPAEQEHLFRLLGVHPGPEIDAYAAAALQGGSLADARRCLDGLHADHLIEETRPGRYQLHDLIRAYADTRADDLTEDDREQALSRVLSYYLRTATVASTYLPGYPEPAPLAITTAPTHSPTITGAADARAWFDVELSTLATCVEHAARGAHPGLAIGLTAALQSFLHSGGHWERASLMHEDALAAAIRTGDRLGEANVRYFHGAIKRLRCEFDEASRSLASSLHLYTELEDLLGQANTLRELGVVRQWQGQCQEAAPILAKAYDLYVELGDRLGQASTLNRLGVVQRELGAYDDATRKLTDAHRLFVDLGDRLGQAGSIGELGVVLRQRGQHQEASRALSTAYRLSVDLDVRLGQAFALVNLGVLHRTQGDYEEATQALTRARDLWLELGFRSGQAVTVRELGVVQRMRGQYEAATETLTCAHRHSKELGARDDEADALNELGDLALEYPAAGDPLAYYSQALAIAQDTGLLQREARALAGQGRCLLNADDCAAATALRQALEIYQRLGLPEAATVADFLVDVGVGVPSTVSDRG